MDPVLLGILLLIGITLSYLPQEWKILRRGSSDGLNPLFLALGVISSTATLFNAVLLQWDILVNEPVEV